MEKFNARPKTFFIAVLLSFCGGAVIAETVAVPPPPGATDISKNAIKPGQPVQIDFGLEFADGVRIQQAAKVILNDVLNASYIYSQDFLASTASVGISQKNLKKIGSEALLRDLLKEHGFGLEKTEKYYRIYKSREAQEDQITTLYRVKNRPLSYISSILVSAFPLQNYGNARSGVSTQQDQKPTGITSMANNQKPTDTGQSMYSWTVSQNTDVIVFKGSKSETARFEKILKDIDTPERKLVLRAVVLETQKSKSEGYSVTGAVSLIADKLKFNITSSSPSGNSGAVFSTNNFNASLSLLNNDASVKVLNSATALIQSGATTIFSKGDSVPTLGNVTSQNGSSQQSIEYKEVGLILKATPQILTDAVFLDFYQELSDAVQTKVSSINSPTITKRSLSTPVTLKPGQVAILGGLTSQKTTKQIETFSFFKPAKFTDKELVEETDLVILLYLEEQKDE